MTFNWTPKDLPELTGKIVVVTGTSAGGIGREIVKHLGLKGAKVYCTARSEARSKATLDGIHKEHPEIKGQLIPLMVDFNSPESVQDAVTELKTKERQVDILINNAGTLAAKLETNDAGWEKQITTNYLGHFIFVNGLMPLLRNAVAAGSDVRVINVSSNAVPILLGKSYEIDWTDRKVYRGEVPAKSAPWPAIYSLFFAADAVRFSVSKLAIVMFAAELQHRFDKEGLPILSVSINPGTADSYGRAPAMLKPALRPLFKSSVITVEEASWNALFFATAEEVKDEKHKGKYHEPGAVVTAAHPYADDLEKRTELWDVTTDEINSYFKSKGRQELGPW